MGKKARDRAARKTSNGSAETATVSERLLPASTATLRSSPNFAERHVERATELVSQGITFRRPNSPKEETAGTALIHQHIADASSFSLHKDAGMLLAFDANQQVISVAVCGLGVFDNGESLMLTINHLVVEPRSRGKGLGTVMVGMVSQLVPPAAKQHASRILINGICATNGRTLYQNAGFTVLPVNTPLLIPFAGGKRIANSNTRYPHWFYMMATL